MNPDYRSGGGHCRHQGGRDQGRLHFLLEARSLFNDGTAAVLFGAAVLAAAGINVGAGIII